MRATRIIAMTAALCATLICARGGIASEVPADCAAYVPYGLPVTTGQHPTTLACRAGYLSQVDGDTLQPDWVAWSLTSERALGCEPRSNAFHYDDKLPVGFYATPGDYALSGRDLGHLSPDRDNAVSADMERDSFDVPTNMSPQAPGLNRLEWESLEETTRAWTHTLGDLYVIDGPIFSGAPSTIGQHKIAVPSAYWKVIIAGKQAVAFTMTNDTHPKGPLTPFVVSIADIERQAGITIPVPAGVDKTKVALPWQADVTGFAKAKKAACAH